MKNKLLKELRYQCRYAMPLWFVQLLTNWLPENRITIRIRGALAAPFLGKCGKNFTLSKNVYLESLHNIEIGNNVYIAPYTWINGLGGLVIEDEVNISPHVVIDTCTHTFKDNSVGHGGALVAPVRIGRGSWIASHALISAGVTIGSGVIVAGNAVVVKDVPDNMMAGGVPARIIGPRKDKDRSGVIYARFLDKKPHGKRADCAIQGSKMVKANGTFVISLDFELYWGAWPGEEAGRCYRESILGVRTAVPLLLKLFREYEIHATWATVGLLFFENRDELLAGLPEKKPNYVNSALSCYNRLQDIGENEMKDPCHYAAALIRMIKSFPNQEIASHTFSHYYCMEEGQDVETFKSDLEAAIKAANKYDINIQSLVFPLNQINSEYLSVCGRMGIKSYRGNPHTWIYKVTKAKSSLSKRGLRFLNTYFNIFGHNCYSIEKTVCDLPFDIRQSRYLRPYSKRLRFLEPLKLRRILSDLTYAAKKGLVYHLWWHPYNFGIYTDKNIALLRKILEHYAVLRDAYGMESLNMGAVSARAVKKG